MQFTLVVLAVVFTTANKARALGINCRGSGLCGFSDPGVANALVGYIMEISDDTVYANGQQIACKQHICAFLQDVSGGGASGSTIKALAPDIPGHGCKACGSVPLQDNNVAEGQLTFNQAVAPCNDGADGLC